MSFKEGDVVQLKSGGPKMTVEAVSGHSSKAVVTCQWFVGGIVTSDKFPPESLMKVNDEFKPPEMPVGRLVGR